MQKPTDGVPRLNPERVRPRPIRASVIARVNRRSVRIARTVQAWLQDLAGRPVGSAVSSMRAGLRPFYAAERALPVAVAAIVALASLLALMPNTTGGAVGGTQGRGQDLRLAISGAAGRQTDGLSDVSTAYEAAGGGATSFQPFVLPDDSATQPGVVEASQDPGSLLDDGTLLTGYAPDTSVADGSDLIERYKVKSGDNLVGIARKFGVSMMTLWWANKLKSKDDLHIGQVLRIPPVSGLVVTVKDTDTLESLASQHGVKPAKILELNGLDDPTLVVGQVLVLPGAKGAPIPTPKPTPKPVAKPRVASSSGGSRPSSRSSGGGHASYTGGQFHWPVVGGGNYISQYFHAGHNAIDIAADYGAPVVAAAGGRVVFAGWKSNGGGWQVWISHGGGTVHDLQPHVVAVRRDGAVRRPRPAGRAHRVQRLGHGTASPLRGLGGRHALGGWQPDQPDALLLAPDPTGRP